MPAGTKINHIIGFGETMIRYTPLLNTISPSRNVFSSFQSVGGDELNVMIALSRLGYVTEWVSILSHGPLVNFVEAIIKESGVKTENCIKISKLKRYQIGHYHVLPALKRVFYERNRSAFSLIKNQFPWHEILKRADWLHATGITPLLGENALREWRNHLDIAQKLKLPFSIDLNYRPQLGSLENLLEIIYPYITNLHKGCCFLIIAEKDLLGFSNWLNINLNYKEITYEKNKDLLFRISQYLPVPLSCCFKKRDEKGVQTRWSILCQNEKIIISDGVIHYPNDECGGGSAWAAGIISSCLDGNNIDHNLFRADLLAALSQESIGDHSFVNDFSLSFYEQKRFLEKKILIPDQEIQIDNTSLLLEYRINKLGKNKIIAILREIDPDAAIKRGQELVWWGCRHLEVTIDSIDWKRVLTELRDSIGAICMLGVGTIYNSQQVREAANLGAQFALSPINPGRDFIETCHNFGLIAVPAVGTPQEANIALEQGAKIVKLFPAQNWTPKAMRDLLTIGNFQKLRIIPTGGIKPENAHSWLNEGAFAVGLGSQLVGPELKESTQYQKKQWHIHGPERASILFNNKDYKTLQNRVWDYHSNNMKVQLSNGTYIPKIGFSLDQLEIKNTEKLVNFCLDIGYEYFDTSSFYKNEVALGNSLRRNKNKRNKIYVSSRIWNDVHSYENTLRCAEQSLRDLDCDYFDTIAVHYPIFGINMGTYQACETLLNRGLTKGISLSDYTIQNFEELLPYIKNLPNSNQMEVNPFVFRKASIEYFSERGIQIISHKPLGKGKYTQHPIILDIAQKINLTPGQVLILWCLYHRLVVMTRSNDPCRIKENLIRDPILSEDNINILDRLTTVENLLTWHNNSKNFR